MMNSAERATDPVSGSGRNRTWRLRAGHREFGGLSVLMGLVLVLVVGWSVPAHTDSTVPTLVAQAAAEGPEAQPGPGAPPEASAGAVPMQSSSGLPQRSAARSMRVYWHVFIAFGLAWALIFGYVLSLGIRYRRLEDEVGRLAEGR